MRGVTCRENFSWSSLIILSRKTLVKSAKILREMFIVIVTQLYTVPVHPLWFMIGHQNHQRIAELMIDQANKLWLRGGGGGGVAKGAPRSGAGCGKAIESCRNLVSMPYCVNARYRKAHHHSVYSATLQLIPASSSLLHVHMADALLDASRAHASAAQYDEAAMIFQAFGQVSVAYLDSCRDRRDLLGAGCTCFGSCRWCLCRSMLVRLSGLRLPGPGSRQGLQDARSESELPQV